MNRSPIRSVAVRTFGLDGTIEMISQGLITSPVAGHNAMPHGGGVNPFKFSGARRDGHCRAQVDGPPYARHHRLQQRGLCDGRDDASSRHSREPCKPPRSRCLDDFAQAVAGVFAMAYRQAPRARMQGPSTCIHSSYRPCEPPNGERIRTRNH